MHSLSYLATLYFWATLFVNHMTYLYKYVSNSLCNMHIHPIVVSLTCIHMLSMHATYHTSLSPVTTHLYMNVNYEVPVVMDTVIFKHNVCTTHTSIELSFTFRAHRMSNLADFVI